MRRLLDERKDKVHTISLLVWALSFPYLEIQGWCIHRSQPDTVYENKESVEAFCHNMSIAA